MSSVLGYRSSRFFAIATSMISPMPALSAVFRWSAGSRRLQVLVHHGAGRVAVEGWLAVTM
jgi:hypothetical protein